MQYAPQDHIRDYAEEIKSIVYEFQFKKPSEIASNCMIFRLQQIADYLIQAAEVMKGE